MRTLIFSQKKEKSMARAVMTLTDYSGERTTVTVNSATLNGANFDTEQTAWTALRTAIQGLTLGNTYSHSLSQVLNVTTLPAPSPLAQRENKWLVTYADTVTGKRYQMEIGTAELDNGHLVANSDMADLSSPDWEAFETAFEAFAVAPDTGNPVALVSAQFVGRKS
jgi:hypothetical protein